MSDAHQKPNSAVVQQVLRWLLHRQRTRQGTHGRQSQRRSKGGDGMCGPKEGNP